MNQIQEKVKDLIEVRSSSQLQDFLTDLVAVLHHAVEIEGGQVREHLLEQFR